MGIFDAHLPADDLGKRLSVVLPVILLVGTSYVDGPLSGFGLVREVHKIYPEIRAVVLLESSQRTLVIEAFRSGARGVFCRSDFEFKALWRCVSAVKRGQIWANSEQLRFLLETLSESAPLHLVNAEGAELLTRREEEVVRQVVDGLSNREIGDSLQLSEHTVKNYLFRIYDKLGVSGRVELATYVFAHDKMPITSAPIEAARKTSAR